MLILLENLLRNYYNNFVQIIIVNKYIFFIFLKKKEKIKKKLNINKKKIK